MKKKPDVLVVLAAILGLGIAVSSVGNSGEVSQVAKVEVQSVSR